MNLKEELMNFDWSLKSIIKVAVGLVVVAIALSIVASVLRPVFRGVTGVAQNFVGEIAGGLGLDADYATTKLAAGRGGGIATDAYYAAEESAIYPPMPTAEGGDNAEEYERHDYNARYETRKFDETCDAIADLKPLDYVVFDYANKSEDWCNYTFRVEIEHEDEVVTQLKALDPRDFSVNVSTIERSVEYTESELAMQQRRLASLQETLTQAEDSFNSLIARATREGDTATLSEVINNKINTIERLNQQILSAQDRVDRLTKSRGEQTEQIEYAHFSASVQKITYIDGEQLGDVWKQRVQQMVQKINSTVLAITIGLVTFFFATLQFVIFASITVIGLVALARVLWVVIKRIWKGKRPVMRSDNDMQM